MRMHKHFSFARRTLTYSPVSCSTTVYKHCSTSGSPCPATSQPLPTRWTTTCRRSGSSHPQYCSTSLIWLTATETQLCTTACLTPTSALSRNCWMQVQRHPQGNWRFILTTNVSHLLQGFFPVPPCCESSFLCSTLIAQQRNYCNIRNNSDDVLLTGKLQQ